MKLIKFLPLFFIFACSKPDAPTKACDCERKLYQFYPAMNGPSGTVLVPARYTYVSSQFGSFDCISTSGYVPAVGSNYTHQTTTCK